MLYGSKKKLQKIVVIVGPTASGKTSLAIQLARLFGGEVVSADSRQVYRGLDIGTDTVTEAEMQGVSHHLIDVTEASVVYTAADFVRDADIAIADIAARGKLPIVVGGTFFYIDVLLGHRTLAGVPANSALRAELGTLSTEELHRKLADVDPTFAEQVDAHNPRRLIRALEIVTAKGTVPMFVPQQRYDTRIIGINVPLEILRERINTRLDETLARGLVEETKQLLRDGISKSRFNEIGLEYRVVRAYLDGAYSYEEMRTVLKQKICQYAKRQRTWLKKMKNIHWVSLNGTAQTSAIIQEWIHSPGKN
jgi:tRNA dimethylallyltransferase